MTTSGNIAGVMTPFAVMQRTAPWPYGGKAIYKIDEIKPGKQPKVGAPLYYGQIGMLRFNRRKG